MARVRLDERRVAAMGLRAHVIAALAEAAGDMAALTQEPQLTRIITANAAGNEHMIAINDTLGFRVLDRCPPGSSTWTAGCRIRPAVPDQRFITVSVLS